MWNKGPPEGLQNASRSSSTDWGSGLAKGKTPDARGRQQTLTCQCQPWSQTSAQAVTQPGDTAWTSPKFHPLPDVPKGAWTLAWPGQPALGRDSSTSLNRELPLPVPCHPRDARPSAAPSTSVPLLPPQHRSLSTGPPNAMPLPCPPDCPGPRLASPTFLPTRCPSPPLQPQALPLLPGQLLRPPCTP